MAFSIPKKCSEGYFKVQDQPVQGSRFKVQGSRFKVQGSRSASGRSFKSSSSKSLIRIMPLVNKEL